MSRTFKDADRRYSYWDDPRPWWRRAVMPKSSLKPWQRLFWKADRQRTTKTLRRGDEPAPTRTRGTIKWDVW